MASDDVAQVYTIDRVDGDALRVIPSGSTDSASGAVTDATLPGVAYSPKGTWLCASSNGQTVNALVPDIRSDIADGACFNDTFVDVTKRE